MEIHKKTILQYIQQTTHSIIAPCGGNGTCGKCQIKIVGSYLSISKKDRQYITPEHLQMGYRLACDHPYQEGMKFTDLDLQGNILTTTKTKENLTINYTSKNLIGCIVDVGTTTVVIQLLRLWDGKVIASKSFFNPQVTYGSDVITRIQFTNEHDPSACTRCIREAIHCSLGELMKDYVVNAEYVNKMMICGNTTMLHFLLGYPTKSLGEYPFHVYEGNCVQKPYREIFQQDLLQIDVVCFPHISAFVGGDIISGIIACNMDQEKDINLLIDLGTNGEIAIGNYERILVSSTAAGPAFEGGNITCGGGSIEGAINDVRFMDDHFEYDSIHDKPANSICGSGLISFISECLSHNIMDDTGTLISGEERIYFNEDVYVCVKDIREFQLAKAAIQSGIQLLIKEYGCDIEEISNIYIAGGLGAHLQKEHLITINLLPKKVLSKIEVVDNSALSGLMYTILSNDIKRAKRIAKMAIHIDLANIPEFNDTLLDAMFFT